MFQIAWEPHPIKRNTLHVNLIIDNLFLFDSSFLWERSRIFWYCQGDNKMTNILELTPSAHIGPSSLTMPAPFSLQASTALLYLLWISQCIAAVFHLSDIYEYRFVCLYFKKKRVLFWIELKCRDLVLPKSVPVGNIWTTIKRVCRLDRFTVITYKHWHNGNISC